VKREMSQKAEKFEVALEELLARALRDSVFEKASSDENWECCRGAWIRTYRLFTAKVREIITPESGTAEPHSKTQAIS
jgi:hypothetical protein